MSALDFSVRQLEKSQWFEVSISELIGDASSFLEAPTSTKVTSWTMSYFRISFSTCTDASIASSMDVIRGLMSDILPIFSKNGRIEVTREATCVVRVTIHDLIPSVSECPKITGTNNTQGADGWTSGEIAAVAVGTVVAAAVVIGGAAAALAPAPAAAAPYASL